MDNGNRIAVGDLRPGVAFRLLPSKDWDYFHSIAGLRRDGRGRVHIDIFTADESGNVTGRTSLNADHLVYYKEDN